MLTVEPVAATAGGAVCAALGALVGAAAPAAAGAVDAGAGAGGGCEQAVASASAAMPPMPFNKSRRLTDAILVSPSLAFDRTRGDAFDDVTLDDQKQDQHRQHHVQRAGHDQPPLGAGFFL